MFHEDDYKVEPAVQAGIDHALTVFRSLAPRSASARCRRYRTARVRIVDLHHRARRRLRKCGADQAWRFLRNAISGGGCIWARWCPCRLRAGGAAAAGVASELQAAMPHLDVVITAGAPGEAPRMDAIPKWDLSTNRTSPCRQCHRYPRCAFVSGFGPAGCLSTHDRRQAFQTRCAAVVDAFEKATDAVAPPGPGR